MQNVYNGLGQLSVQYQSTSGSVNTSSTPSVQYAYSDPSTGSRLSSMTYPNGRVISYNYGSSGGLDDSIGRLASLADSTGTLQSYAYQGLSTVLQETDGNGLQLNITQDALGRTAEHDWINTAAGSASVDDTTYTYDRDGNVLTQGNPLDPSLSDAYTYDNLNRLTDDTRGGSDHQSWTLDALGNSSSVTTDGTSRSRSTNAQNQLTSMGGSTLAFDADGNEITDDTGKTLIYDAWNRLVEAKDGTGGASLIRYQYDALGHRDKEGSSSIYFSKDWQEVEDRNASGQVTAQYVYSPVYIDAMIERDRDTNGDGTVDERLYVLQNANYDVTAIATTSGTIAERFAYDAYGARTVLNSSWGSTTDAYAFTQGHQGGKVDAVTGYVNFRNRELNTNQMRWMEEDPLAEWSGSNFYASTASNPAALRDPFGLSPTTNPLQPPEMFDPIKIFGIKPPVQHPWTWAPFPLLVSNAVESDLLNSLPPRVRNCRNCQDEANDLGRAIHDAVENQMWQFGGSFGNWISGNTEIMCGRGLSGSGWGNQCGDWQSLLLNAIKPIMDAYGDSSCFSAQAIDASDSDGNTHNWIELSTPSGVVTIDPWPSGGRSIIDTSQTKNYPIRQPYQIGDVPKWKSNKKKPTTAPSSPDDCPCDGE